MDGGSIYWAIGYILAIVTFFASWAFAIASWGFLLGVGLGWIPSFFIGLIAFAIGPALVFLGILFFGAIYFVDWIGVAI